MSVFFNNFKSVLQMNEWWLAFDWKDLIHMLTLFEKCHPCHDLLTLTMTVSGFTRHGKLQLCHSCQLSVKIKINSQGFLIQVISNPFTIIFAGWKRLLAQSVSWDPEAKLVSGNGGSCKEWNVSQLLVFSSDDTNLPQDKWWWTNCKFTSWHVHGLIELLAAECFSQESASCCWKLRGAGGSVSS